jgi:hypothetical protein
MSKFLIACALIAAMSETAMAQTTIPEKCQNLHVTDYTIERNNSGSPTLYALVHNDDPYNATYAIFYFDLLIGENFKIGQGQGSIQRLLHGDTERIRIFYTSDRDIRDTLINLRLVSITCNFSGS